MKKEQTALIGLNSYLFTQFFRSRKSGLITHYLIHKAKYAKGINKDSLPKITNLVFSSNVELTNLILLVDKFEDATRYENILAAVQGYLHKELNVYVVIPKANNFEELSELSIKESLLDAPFKFFESKLLADLYPKVKRIYTYNYYNPLSPYTEECKQVILKANKLRQELAWTDMKQLIDNVMFDVSTNKKKINTVLKSKEFVTYVSQGMLVATSNLPTLDFGVCLNKFSDKVKFEYKMEFDGMQTKQVLSSILDKL
jgi:tRNA-binding EMAP/Myf-like protein